MSVSRRVYFLVALVIVTATLQLGITLLYEHANEGIEHTVMKGSFLHAFWEGAGRNAVLPNKKDGSLVVFQHVPRTAGDAMRTHLFFDVQADGSHIWPNEFKDHTFGEDEDLEIAELNTTRLIKGFYSKRDLDKIKRKKEVFLFLRHPIERVLSLHAMVRPYKTVYPQPDGSTTTSPTDEGSEGVPDHMNASRFVQDPDNWACSMTHDSMAWQLGDQQQCKARGNLSDAQVLAQAMETIEKADFVGFYETLDEDFWSLKQRIFPHVQLAAYIPLAFWLGTHLSLPRLRVTKYTAALSREDLEQVEAKNVLDMKLYTWAVKKYRPHLKLYDDYASFMADHIFAVVAVSICISILCVGSLLCTYRLCRQVWSWRSKAKESI